MATQLAAPTVGVTTHSRMHARGQAASAMQLAAHSLAIEPAVLSTAAYRTFRATTFRATQQEPSLPSPLAISLLFFGWRRACEHLVALTCDEEGVEADVVRALYGDPSCRQRAHATCGHDGTVPAAGQRTGRVAIAQAAATPAEPSRPPRPPPPKSVRRRPRR